MKKLSILYILILLSPLLIISSQLPTVNASPDIETGSPSSNYGISGRWLTTTFAYSSDDTYAYTGVSAQQGYGDYDFTFTASDEITKVEVGLEGYLTSGGVGYYVSWDDGASFTYLGAPLLGSEHLHWEDATDYTEWTMTKLDNDHLKTKIFYQAGSGACYGLDAEVGLWQGGMKYVRDVVVGDVLTGWNVSKLEVKGEFENWNITNFSPATVTKMTIHNGTWNVLRIIMESVYRPHDFKDVLVTPDHILPYYKVEYESDGSLDKIVMETQKAEDFGEDDYVFGFIHETINWTTEEIIPAHFEPYKFYNVTEMVVDGVADIKTDCKWFMGHYMLAEKVPWTGYVDWIPVRVTYVAGEEEEEIDCNWIGVDNTVAGVSTQFTADWTDMNQTNGLSHFRFYTNNTGTWTNDTWSSSWNGNWSRATYALNSITDLIIAFRFYVNDTSGVEHASSICFFLDAQAVEETSKYMMQGALLMIPIMLAFLLYARKNRQNS